MSTSLELSKQLEGAGALSPIGLELDPSISRDRFEAIGALLGHLHTSLQWAVGDWLIAGEKFFGQDSYQLAESLGISAESKAQYLRVAEAVPSERRITGLSWSHHRAVAHLSETEQEVYLAKAWEHGWSKRELEAATKHELGPASRKSKERVAEAPVIILNAVHDAARDVYEAATETTGNEYVVPSDHMDRLGQTLGLK